MRTHTTLTLRNLILHDMDPGKCQMSQHEIEIWKQTLPMVRDEMFKYIDFIIGSIFQKGLVRRQIRQVHAEAVFLLNAIDRSGELVAGLEDLKTEVIACLDAVLGHLMLHGKKYLDPETLVPVSHLKREQTEYTLRMTKIQALMNGHGVTKNLQDLVLGPMANLCKGRKCTYAMLEYLKHLQTLLLAGCQTERKADPDSILISLLLEANYNSSDFIKYVQTRITAELAEIYELKAQFERLYHYQRQFQCSPLRKSAGSFDPGRRKVKDLMLDFINAEIKYLQNKEKVLFAAPGQAFAGVPNPAPAKNSAYRIQTRLSVDSLAYFIRLLIAANVIEARVKTELLAFVAEIFHTPGMPTAGISAGSLGTKYKQVVQSTAVKVRAALRKMLKQLDQDFSFD
jgi:hypothetical protein